MNKLIKTGLICLILVLAAAIVIGFVCSQTKTDASAIEADRLFTMKDTSFVEESIDEDDTLFFDTFEEYISYLSDQRHAECYYSPEGVPADAVLYNIAVSSEGTSFNYYLERDAALQQVDISRTDLNVIELTTDDYLLDGLTHAAISRVYSTSINNVTDYEEFAENLAEAIGADQTFNTGYGSTIYYGSIYADVYDTTTSITTRYFVGEQRVYCVNMGGGDFTVMYSYTPYTMTSAEINSFADLVPHDLLINDNRE